MSNRNGLMGKASSAIVAGLLAASMVAPTMALAADNTASAGAQTGSGETDLYMILENTGEYGGTETENNKDTNADPDDWGDNLAFSVPSRINYVLKANGDLVGPDNGADIQNHSSFKVHVSSVDVNNVTDFNIVSQNNFGSASAANTVAFDFGPTNGKLDAASYLTKAAIGPKFVQASTYNSTATYYTKSGSTYTAATVADAEAFASGTYYTRDSEGTESSATVISAWNMAADDGDTSAADQVQMTTSGNAKNITADVTAQTKFGEIHWYLTPGEAATIA